MLYGLETAEVGMAELNRIDAFQIRGVRKIFGKKHTYWDRSATKDVLFDMASRIVSKTNSKKTQEKRKRTKKNKKTRRREKQKKEQTSMTEKY